MKRNHPRGIVHFGAILLIFIIWQTVIAKPPEKRGNPGVSGLLAEMSKLNDIVETQQGTIEQQLAKIEEMEEMLDQLQNFASVP